MKLLNSIFASVFIIFSSFDISALVTPALSPHPSSFACLSVAPAKQYIPMASERWEEIKDFVL